MKTINQIEAAQELARLYHRPVLVISSCSWWKHMEARPNGTFGPPSAPFLNLYGTDPARIYGSDHAQLLSDGRGIVICEDEAEQEFLYSSCVGDDGPTELNPYNGPDRTYVLTISADGELRNENT